MTEQSNNPFNFWNELKRRKVVRVITVYAAASFVLLELVDIISEPFGLPDWTLRFVFVLLFIGFLISFVMSWIFDITPEGVQKTKPVNKDDKVEKSITSNGWKISTYVSVVIIIGLVLFNVFTRKKSVDLSDLENTLAILPFENLGPNDNNSTLEHALPIAIMMKLQGTEGLIIIHWGSTKSYLETSLANPDIGIELKVNYLVRGYYQQQGNNILVDIILTHASSDEVIDKWSYNMVAEDLIEVQNSISKRIASALKNKFMPEEDILTNNTDALYAFTTGLKYYWKDESVDDFRLAIWHFEKAIALDSNFIQAYFKLSTSHCWVYQYHYDRTQYRLDEARKAIDKIYEIDGSSPDGMLAEGLYHYITHDYDKALELYIMTEGQVFDKVELDMAFAALYRRQRNLNQAIHFFLKAEKSDPQNRVLLADLGETYLLRREYERAEDYFDRVRLMGGYQIEENLVNLVDVYLLWEKDNKKSRIALDKEWWSRLGEKSSCFYTHYKVWIDLIDRNYEDALITLNQNKFDSLSHQFLYRPMSLYYGEIYHYQNNPKLARLHYESARIHLEEKIADFPEDTRIHSSLGIAYAALGRKKEAIERGLAAISLMPIKKDFYRGIFRLKDLATIYTMVGEYDLALEQIDELLSMPSLMSVNLLKKDPVWEPLWELPGFKELIDKYSEN